jgi:hypothetical protein
MNKNPSTAFTRREPISYYTFGGFLVCIAIMMRVHDRGCINLGNTNNLL